MAYPSALQPDADWMISAARLDGWSRAFGIGYNPSVDTGGVPASAWGGVGPYPWLTGLTSLELLSVGGAADVNTTGTGAWLVLISGLDGNYDAISDTIALNGTNPVALPRQYLRINSMRVTQAGSGRKNVGTITLRDVGGAQTVRALILAGKGTSRQAAFTVPRGFMLEVPEILLVVDNLTGATARKASIETYFAGVPPAPAILPLPIGNTNVSPYNHIIHPPINVAQMNDFDLSIVNVSDNSTIITAAWNGILKRMSG